MIKNNVIKSALLMLVLVTVILFSANFIDSWALNNEGVSIVDEIVFPHDEVVMVSMAIEADDYEYMLNNAMLETYITADVTYNGYTFNDIAIRPKGNSSLKSVAQDPSSDRYSFKVDFNYYVDGQSFFGLTKLNLNNIYGDASYMREYIAYEAMEDMGIVAPRTTYVELYINDQYFGLYLVVEDVNDSFLYSRFDDPAGVLYKPDMDIGADLVYIDDQEESYPGIYPENDTNESNDDIIYMMKVFDEMGDVTEVFDVDNFLRYLAVGTFTVHLDSYQGGMYHNYYLYNDDGYFTFIPWDLNMIFNGFPAMDDSEAIHYLIDEPVIGNMSDYPIIEVLLADEVYMNDYHTYLEALMAGYFEEDTFRKKVDHIYDMIHDYVLKDPTAFYTFDQFEAKIYTGNDLEMGILEFVEKRSQSVKEQLSGQRSSTNDGMGNVSYRGFNIENRVGNVGAEGFGVEGRPVETIDMLLSSNDLAMPNMNEGDIPNDLEGVAPSEGLQIQLLNALKAMDNLPDDIAEYIRQDLLPPKNILDQYLMEEGLTVDGLLRDQVNVMPQGQMNQNPQEINDLENDRNVQQDSHAISKTDQDLAQYMVIGTMLLLTLGLTFGISKLKR